MSFKVFKICDKFVSRVSGSSVIPPVEGTVQPNAICYYCQLKGHMAYQCPYKKWRLVQKIIPENLREAWKEIVKRKRITKRFINSLPDDIPLLNKMKTYNKSSGFIKSDSIDRLIEKRLLDLDESFDDLHFKVTQEQKDKELEEQMVEKRLKDEKRIEIKKKIDELDMNQLQNLSDEEEEKEEKEKEEEVDEEIKEYENEKRLRNQAISELKNEKGTETKLVSETIRIQNPDYSKSVDEFNKKINKLEKERSQLNAKIVEENNKSWFTKRESCIQQWEKRVEKIEEQISNLVKVGLNQQNYTEKIVQRKMEVAKPILEEEILERMEKIREKENEEKENKKIIKKYNIDPNKVKRLAKMNENKVNLKRVKVIREVEEKIKRGKPEEDEKYGADRCGNGSDDNF